MHNFDKVCDNFYAIFWQYFHCPRQWTNWIFFPCDWRFLWHFSAINWGISHVFPVIDRTLWCFMQRTDIIWDFFFLLYINKFCRFYSWDWLANFPDLLWKFADLFFHVNVNEYCDFFFQWSIAVLWYFFPASEWRFLLQSIDECCNIFPRPILELYRFFLSTKWKFLDFLAIYW